MWRVYLVYIFICLFGIAIIYKTFQIQTFEGDKWRSMAASLTTTYMNIEAVRGNIYATDGSLLATSIPTYEIRFDAMLKTFSKEVFYRNVDSLAYCLSKLFPDKSEKQYRRELITARQEGDRYYLIRRNVNYNQLNALKKFPLFRLGRYRGGLIYIQKNRRQMPFNQLAARTIGYDRKDLRPVGIEGAYSKYLRGVSGKRLMQKISGGVWKPINDDNEIEPEDGSDLITTIDVNIQDVAEYALARELVRNDADHGCVVLMEVATGEIKAIANLKKAESGGYNEMYNYAVGESTEPGSTFKLASLISAIEDGFIDLDDSIDTRDGTRDYYDRVMRDSHKGGYGKISVKQAFEKSSNVGISRIITEAYGNNPQKFVDRLYKMNLNDPLGLDIAGEGQPKIKKPKDRDWSGTTLPWMSVGYEVRFTPLQILVFYNAVANDGVMVKPLFIKEILRRGKIVKSFNRVVVNESICSRATIEKAKKLLEGVIENGTGQNLKNPNYNIAGKTGTVQIANDKYGYKYDGKYSYQASFVGYFPAENPKYSCIVVINAPSNDVYYGNLVAGPIFKEIADKVYASALEIHDDLADITEHNWGKREDGSSPIPYVTYGYRKDLQNVLQTLGIPATYQDGNSRWAVAYKADSAVNIMVRNLDKDIERGLVPNVVGMTAEDAIYLLENAGLKVKILGYGMIVSQSVKPGTPIYKDSEILLELS